MGWLPYPQHDVVRRATTAPKPKAASGQPQLDAQTSKPVLQGLLAIYEAAQMERPVQPDAVT